MLYPIIYGDMPWSGYTACGTARLPYETMTEDELKAFDWSRYMAKRCVLLLWVTGPKLDVAFRCVEAWKVSHGLRYVGVAYKWIKTTMDGKPIRAAGPRPTGVKPLGEDVIMLTNVKRGRPLPLLTESQVQWCNNEDAIVESHEVLAPKAKRGEHSRKPAVVRTKIVELFGDLPRIELFARERVRGWHGTGLEYPPASFPVTDDETDAPDGAIVNGYERVGDLWVWRDVPAWERAA